MKSLTVLGCTGSIGQNTLDIVAKFPEHFKARVLAAKTSVDLLAEQIQSFQPEAAVVYTEQYRRQLMERLPSGLKTEILVGTEGYCDAAAWDGVDMVVGAMVGAAGLKPILAAVEAGKDIALANKETLVMAGKLVTETVARKSVQLLPVDSEHSAIFQCLQGHRRQDLYKIVLTASGGPFLKTPAESFRHIKPDQALKHPNWQMGAKITIDSATLMNKGLEVIEAKWLFDLSDDEISVLVHPQSIVHSMVSYCDGSMIAQLGIPDMKGAIAYALSFPQRLPLRQPLPDLADLQALTFEAPDFERFPCLQLAFDANRSGGTMPAVLNAANEVAVHAFLEGRIRLTDIHEITHRTMASHHIEKADDLDTILAADAWARHFAQLRVEASGKI